MNIVKMDEFHVTGLLIQASWDELWKEMPKAWQLFFSRYQEIEERKNDCMMDISLRKEKDLYTQLIGVEVLENKMPIPSQMTTKQFRQKNIYITGIKEVCKKLLLHLVKCINGQSRNIWK